MVALKPKPRYVRMAAAQEKSQRPSGQDGFDKLMEVHTAQLAASKGTSQEEEIETLKKSCKGAGKGLSGQAKQDAIAAAMMNALRGTPAFGRFVDHITGGKRDSFEGVMTEMMFNNYDKVSKVMNGAGKGKTAKDMEFAQIMAVLGAIDLDGDTSLKKKAKAKFMSDFAPNFKKTLCKQGMHLLERRTMTKELCGTHSEIRTSSLKALEAVSAHHFLGNEVRHSMGHIFSDADIQECDHAYFNIFEFNADQHLSGHMTTQEVPRQASVIDALALEVCTPNPQNLPAMMAMWKLNKTGTFICSVGKSHVFSLPAFLKHVDKDANDFPATVLAGSMPNGLTIKCFAREIARCFGSIMSKVFNMEKEGLQVMAAIFHKSVTDRITDTHPMAGLFSQLDEHIKRR